MFKLWSETNQEIKEQLKPDLWIRNWNSLNKKEKEKIWKYLEEYFFNKDKKIYKNTESFYWNRKYDYQFFDIFRSFDMRNIIYSSIFELNQKYKSQSYWENFLNEKTLLNACDDFYHIFINQDENIIIELLSFYSKILINWSFEKNNYLLRKKDEAEENYQIRFTNYQYQYFDNFSKRLNEVFDDFWLNIILTKQWFISKQWEKIIEEIYKPTLDFLSDIKYKEVNRDLWDAFSDYHKKDYSWTITKTISAIQAFLQIEVNWRTWNWQILQLQAESIKKWIITDDIFIKTIFKNLESVFAQERMDKWDSHPKNEYATEQNARLILNIAMVYIQHFIQIKI